MANSLRVEAERIAEEIIHIHFEWEKRFTDPELSMTDLVREAMRAALTAAADKCWSIWATDTDDGGDVQQTASECAERIAALIAALDEPGAKKG